MTVEQRVRHGARRRDAAVLGEHRRRPAGAADPRARPERRRVVADRRRAVADDARDHVRPPRHRALGVARCPPTRPRRWPTTPCASSTSSASTPRTSTASRSAAWSRSSWRCATRERVRSLVLGATQPGGRRAVRADDEVMAFFRRRSHMGKEEAAWASVPYNYGPRCRERARRPHRRGHRAAARATRSTRRPTARSSSRRRCTTATGGSTASRVPTMVVHGGARSRHPGRERAPDGRAAPGQPADAILEDSGHLYPTEEPEVDEEIGAFFAGATAPTPCRACARALLELTSVQVLDELRVADVVRQQRRDASGRRRDPPRRPRAHLRRSSTSARTAWPRRCSPRASGPASRVAHLDRTAPEVVELLLRGRARSAPWRCR